MFIFKHQRHLVSCEDSNLLGNVYQNRNSKNKNFKQKAYFLPNKELKQLLPLSILVSDGLLKLTERLGILAISKMVFMIP